MADILLDIFLVGLTILIFYLLIRYSTGLKALLKALIYSFIISLLAFWVLDVITPLPDWLILFFMAVLIVLNIIYHNEED